MNDAIENILFMEIRKGCHNEPCFGQIIKICVENNKYKNVLEEAIKKDKFPCGSRVPSVGGNGLSFNLYPGYNAYAFKFYIYPDDNQALARFGPHLLPISFVGCKSLNVEKFVKGVEMAANLGGKIKYFNENKIPIEYRSVPKNNWAIVKIDLPHDNNFITHNHGMKIPFYLNIYDEKYEVPIWQLGEDKQRTHNGYHPPGSAYYANVVKN